MRLLITGPSHTACRLLLEALEARNLSVAIGRVSDLPTGPTGLGAGPNVDPDIRQILLAPPELPFDFNAPKEYIHVNSERELTSQVAAVIEETRWKAAS